MGGYLMVEEKDYYKSKKSEFFAQFNDFCESIGFLIEQKYGEKFKKEVMGEIKEEYGSLYEEIPYIGGDLNGLSFDLVGAVQSLALYKVLKKHGKPVKEIGELAYQAEEESLKNNPETIPPMTHPQFIFHIKGAADESLKKRYPGDWVYKFIETEEDDYGLDFIECGIQKFFHEHDADEFTPYLCAMDIIMSECGNLGLHRTQTLAEGSDHCDFRYKGGRKTNITSTVIKID
jgi:hypothetical protein